MIEPTEAQWHELPPVIVNPQTQEEYVLIRKSVYERIKGLLDDDARLMYPMLAEIDPDDWEDASNYDDKP
jgi:hypothetical protein